MKISKQMVNNRENREGVKGWLNPSRYGWERISYWFQRLTGIFLLMYFIGRVYEISSLVRGKNNNLSHLTIVKGLGYGLR
jgi:succinate dehydrogenase/fumarate reductase cytochrome b subunit